MAYIDLTSTFGYNVRIDSNDLTALMENDRVIQDFIPYHNRPSIQRLSATEIRFKANNKSSVDMEADVLFPDGVQIKSVQNNPASKNIFDITRAGDWTTVPSGYQGGLRPGISESVNTWYAMYCIKIISGGNPIDAVMIGDDTLPLQVNVPALNTRYGQNNWIYLGMIRNGDSALVTGDILDFVVVRNRTYFKNIVDGNNLDGNGISLAGGTSTGLTWAYSAGTGDLQLPDHIEMAEFSFRRNADTLGRAMDFGSNKILCQAGMSLTPPSWQDRVLALAKDGVRLDGATSVGADIFLTGFVDPVLGIGFNPQI